MEKIKNIGRKFKGFIHWFLIILGGIGAIITIIVFHAEVWKVLSAIWNFLINPVVRWTILSLLVILLIVGLVRLNRRIKRLSPPKEKGVEGKDVSKLRDDFKEYKKGITEKTQKLDKDIRELRQSLSQIYAKAKKYEQIMNEIKPEHIFILETLGAKLDKEYIKGPLYGIFRANFKFDSTNEANISFNTALEWLEEHGCIEQIPSMTIPITYHIKITRTGFKYIPLAREMMKEKKKKKMEEEEKEPL